VSNSEKPEAAGDERLELAELARHLAGVYRASEVEGRFPEYAAGLEQIADYIEHLEATLVADGWVRAGSNWLKNNRA
jgi:hypothetical protein